MRLREPYLRTATPTGDQATNTKEQGRTTPPGGTPDSVTEEEQARLLFFLHYSRLVSLVVVVLVLAPVDGTPYLIYNIILNRTECVAVPRCTEGQCTTEGAAR